MLRKFREEPTPEKTILTFLVLTFAVSIIFYLPIIAGRTLRAWDGLAVLGLAWTPGIAALFTRLLFQKDLRGTGWAWGKTRYQALSYFTPLCYALAAYGAAWLTGVAGVLNPQYLARLAVMMKVTNASPALIITIYGAIIATLGVLWSSLSAAGEEIGWRGLLVPELAKITSYTKTSLISGSVWAVWHFPLIFFADYNAGTPLWYGTVCFTIMIVGTSFAYAWLRLRSGSVWTAVIFHSCHNLFIQAIFDPLSIDRGIARYVITEFGAGLAFMGLIIGIVFWSRRRMLEPERSLVG